MNKAMIYIPGAMREDDEYNRDSIQLMSCFALNTREDVLHRHFQSDCLFKTSHPHTHTQTYIAHCTLHIAHCICPCQHVSWFNERLSDQTCV
jgi:hypothetical protein